MFNQCYISVCLSSEPKDIVTEAMRCMISQLKEDLHTLPTPLIVFFKMAQEEVEEKEVEVGRDCVGLQVCRACPDGRVV